MPVIRVNRLLWALVAALALLFAVLEPPATRALPFPAALAFWALHIGVGMLLAVQATEWLSRSARVAGWPPGLRVLVGGLVGSALFAPFALAVDLVLPSDTFGEPPDGLLDHWEAGGGPLALLAEWLQLSPSYLASWLLVNAVPLAFAPRLRSGPLMDAAPAATTAPDPMPSTAVDDLPSVDRAPSPSPPPGSEARGAVLPPAGPDEPGECSAAGGDPVACPFIAQLPPAIGTDLIAIQADLHYLQVRTVRGRATVLASIAAAEAALGERGLRVHRSYWVALRHVTRLARTARGVYLVLSDGSRVPVSRRRASEVQSRLGRDFVVDPP